MVVGYQLTQEGRGKDERHRQGNGEQHAGLYWEPGTTKASVSADGLDAGEAVCPKVRERYGGGLGCGGGSRFENEGRTGWKALRRWWRGSRRPCG